MFGLLLLGLSCAALGRLALKMDPALDPSGIWHRSGQQIDADMAGQDIVLHYALALLNDAGLLGRDAQGTPGPLLFKGGTALRKCLFGSTGRFSQDIDLDATSAIYSRGSTGSLSIASTP